MKILKKGIGRLIVLLGLTLHFGCGYHLSGTGSALPPHLKTLAVPVFQNTSTEPEIHRDLTNIIRQSFIKDGRVKIVNEGDADMLMKGVLNYYNLRAISFNTSDVASEYYVELGVDIKVKDQVKKRLMIKQKFKTKWDFRTSADVIGSESARQEALKSAYEDLGNRLVSMIVDQF